MAASSSAVERAKARRGVSSGSSGSSGVSSAVARAKARRGISSNSSRSPLTGAPGSVQAGALAALSGAQQRKKGIGPAFTPIRVALDVASAPFYATGNLLSGDPLEALKNLTSFGQLGRKQFVSDAPIVARGIESVPGPDWLKTALGVTVDFATDPLTWVSGGAGGAIRGAAGRAAKEVAAKAARDANDMLIRATQEAKAAGKKRANPRAVVEAMIRAAEGRAAGPKSLKLYARAPLTRNRRALVAESKLMHRALDSIRVGIRETPTGTALRSLFRADRGTSPTMREGRLGAQYWAESTTREFQDAIAAARKEAAGLGDETELAEFATRHLDQPLKYPPRNDAERIVADLARVIRDETEDIAVDAGIAFGRVPNYIMHLPADKKTAIAFERRYGSKAENQPYTQKRVLDNLDLWEAEGLKPELNVWKLLEVRAEQGIRDASLRAYHEAGAARGAKPLPMRAPDVGGQALVVDEAQAYLDSLLPRISTKPARRAVRQARANLTSAREALRVAQTEPNRAAVARAERALANAQAQAQPAAIMARPARSGQGTVGDVASRGLETASAASRSRGATFAALPEATGGRFRTRTPVGAAAHRLMRRANQLRAEAETAESALYAALRPMAKSVREGAKRASKAHAESTGGLNLGSTMAAYARDIDPGIGAKRNVADPVGRTAGRGTKGGKGQRYYVRQKGKGQDADPVAGPFKTKRERDAALERLEGIAPEGTSYYKSSTGAPARPRDKSFDELVDDVVEQMRRDPNLTAQERQVVEEFDRFAAMRSEADDIERAVRARNAAEDSIEFGPEERAAGRARFDELAEGMGTTVDARARRARNASPAETPRMARNVPGGGSLRGFTAGAKARFRDNFTSEGPLEGAIRGAREEALAEVEGAQRVTRREVENAQRHLAVAKTMKDEEGVRYAQRQLKLAQRTERAVSEQLAAARQTFGGTPKEAARATRALIAEQATLRRMESQAHKIAEANAALARRPGREVSHDEYRELVGQGWSEHTSKYHKGTMLPPDVAEAVRVVDAETLKLFTSDAAVAQLTGFLRQIGTAWKALALLSPRYHLRNFGDDGLTDWFAGARNPISYVEAAQIKGGMTTTVQTKLYGEVDGKLLLAMAETQGVLHQGFAAWDLAKQQQAGFRRGLRPSAPGSGYVARTSRKVGEVREDWTRMGLYIERLKAGDDWIEAGRTVRRYRYDYADLSPFLMGARTVLIPFLTFTWKTLPLLAHIGATRPGVFSKTNIIVEWLNEMGGFPDRDLMPPWMRDSFGIPLPGWVASAFGGQPGEPMVFNPRMTFRYGTLDLLDPRPDALSRNIGGQFGPAALPFTGITGYSLFRGRQFREGERARAPAPIVWLESLGLPIPNYGPKRDSYTGEEGPGYSARAHEILSGFPPFQQFGSMLPGGGVTDWRRALLRFSTGADISPEARARNLHFAERHGRSRGK